MKDSIARRRAVLNAVIRAVAEQLPLEGQQFTVRTREEAWKQFLSSQFYPGQSSEDVIRRDNWNETVLAIESWAAARGCEFHNREDKA